MRKDYSIKETVEKRYSVRTFSEEKITYEVKNQIMEYASRLKNPLGPGIRVQWLEKEASKNGEKLGTYGVIKGATNFLGVTVPNEEFAQEALGYEFEDLVLYATSLNLGTCWLGGTFDRNAFTQALEIKENELFPIISPIGYPADKKRFTEKIFRRSLNADNRMDSKELFFKDDFATALFEKEMGEYQFPLEMLRQAPSAVNKQPWRVVKKDGAFHFFEKRTMNGEGPVDMQRIDMGIGICHFHFAAMEKGLEGHFERKDNLGIEVPADTIYITSWC